MEVKKAFGEKKIKRSFLLFILLIYLSLQRLIEEPGKLLIDHLANINLFFFSMIHWNQKEGLDVVSTRLGCGSKNIFEDKIEEIISIICFIYIFCLSKVNRGAG